MSSKYRLLYYNRIFTKLDLLDLLLYHNTFCLMLIIYGLFGMRSEAIIHSSSGKATIRTKAPLLGVIIVVHSLYIVTWSSTSLLCVPVFVALSLE